MEVRGCLSNTGCCHAAARRKKEEEEEGTREKSLFMLELAAIYSG